MDNILTSLPPMNSSALPSSIAGFTPILVSYAASSTHILYARAHSGSKKSKSNAKGKQRAALPEGRTLFLVNVPPDATEREIILFFKASGTVERVLFDGDMEGQEGSPGDESGSEDEEDDVADENGRESEEEQDKRPRKRRRASKKLAPEVVPLPSHHLRTLRRTGRSAHIVFLDATSLDRALAPAAKAKLWPTDTSVPLGLAHYAALHASLRPPLDVVKAHADSWMALFEFEQAQKKHDSKYHKGEAIVDEDGFTLVTRGGAYGKTLGGEVGVASKKFQAEQAIGHSTAGGKRNRKVKGGTKQKEGFYAFQIHEKKRQELLDLKKKWEEDKAKVEKLKESRKFKPY